MSTKGTNFWRLLFRPDVLFLIGTLQALAPFAFYAAGLLPELNPFHVNYLAAFIWVIGYITFWIGTRLVPKLPMPLKTPDVPVSFKALKTCVALLSFVGVVDVIGLIRVYGGIPLLLFASGAASVNDTNQAEASSGFGQIGIAFLTASMLFSIVGLLGIKASIHRVSLPFWIVPPLLLATTLVVFNGKRQGLVMFAVILAAAAAVRLKSPFRFVDAIVRLRAGSGLSMLFVVFGIAVAAFAFSSLVGLRNNGSDGSTLADLGSYYIFPAMGHSGVCNLVGFGPFEFKPIGILASLIPAKLNLPASWIGTPPPRFEITAGDAFYVRIQWDTGIAGIIVFQLLCGALCQWMYQRAFSRYAALLSYAYIAFALFSSAIYNHFLELMFIPLPIAIFWFTSIGMHEIKNLTRLSSASLKLNPKPPAGS